MPAARGGPTAAAAPDPAGRVRRRAVGIIGELRTAEDWARVLGGLAGLQDRSFSNSVLILDAVPGARKVATEAEWQAAGRSVLPGAHRIEIVEPGASGRRDDWTAATVIDISQTTGPAATLPPPGRSLTPEHLWAVLTDVLDRDRYTLVRDPAGEIAGVTDFDDRTVHIDPGLDPVAAVAALAHEVAHVQLHNRHRIGARTTAICARRERAEAVSLGWLLLARCGIRTELPPLPDPWQWAHTPHDLEKIGRRILTRTSRLTQLADRTGTDRAADLESAADADLIDAERVLRSVRTSSARIAAAEPVTEQLDPRLIQANLAAAGFYADQFGEPAAAHARDYLAGRGLDPRHPAVAAAGTGYAPRAWRGLTDHLLRLGFTETELVAAGLSYEARNGKLIDVFRDRLVWPICHPAGPVAGFTGRTLASDGEIAAHKIRKYLNTRTTALFDKSRLLLGLSEHRDALAAGRRPVLVEGATGYLAILIGTWPDGDIPLGSCGTALTPGQVGLLAQHVPPGTTVVMAHDGDEAGQLAAIRAFDVLQAGLPAPLADAAFQDGNDPADILQSAGPEAVRAALADVRHLADRVVDAAVDRWAPQMDNALARVDAIRSVTARILEFRPQEQPRQLHRVQLRFGLEEGEMWEIVEEMREKAGSAGRVLARGRRADTDPDDPVSLTALRDLPPPDAGITAGAAPGAPAAAAPGGSGPRHR